MIRLEPFGEGVRLDLYDGETCVGSAKVYDRWMRIGGSPVRCGGVADVRIEREYRGQGHGRRLMEECLSYMREAGYHLSALYGIPGFYDKFGYAPALPGSQCIVSLRDAELARARYAVRPAHPEDFPTLAQIYEAMHAARTGSCIRHPATWRGFRVGARFGDRIDAFVIHDRGRILGYASYELDPWSCEFGELGYADPTTFDTFLAEAARQALAKRVDTITFNVPPDDPFAVYCRRYGCRMEVTYQRNARGMARIIDQRGLLERLEPLLCRRAQEAGLSAAGTLHVETDLGRDRVRLGSTDRDLHVRMPQWTLAQLVLGYRCVGDALLDAEVSIEPAAASVLEAIFPTGFPYIYASDRF